MNDIDFVLLWVDGNDPEWLKEKSKYSPSRIDDSNSSNRFKDLGLLKYWFRAVEVYTPWVRKIHFVTWGHLPSFLNTSHPKLHIVNHKEYIPAKWLPTFSSHTLELNIHRINGLSDFFVYFNDDTFLNKPLPNTYFFRDGLPCANYSEIPLAFKDLPEVWICAAANGLGVINENFNKWTQIKKSPGKYFNARYALKDNFRSLLMEIIQPSMYTGFRSFHCPAAFTKKTFEEVWNKQSSILELTSSHKFRDKSDVNQWLLQWWQIASGAFNPQRLKTCTFQLVPEITKDICKAILSHSYDMICLSDSNDNNATDQALYEVVKAFESALPQKSSFER